MAENLAAASKNSRLAKERQDRQQRMQELIDEGKLVCRQMTKAEMKKYGTLEKRALLTKTGAKRKKQKYAAAANR